MAKHSSMKLIDAGLGTVKTRCGLETTLDRCEAIHYVDCKHCQRAYMKAVLEDFRNTAENFKARIAFTHQYINEVLDAWKKQ